MPRRAQEKAARAAESLWRDLNELNRIKKNVAELEGIMRFAFARSQPLRHHTARRSGEHKTKVLPLEIEREVQLPAIVSSRRTSTAAAVLERGSYNAAAASSSSSSSSSHGGNNLRSWISNSNNSSHHLNNNDDGGHSHYNHGSGRLYHRSQDNSSPQHLQNSTGNTSNSAASAGPNSLWAQLGERERPPTMFGLQHGE